MFPNVRLLIAALLASVFALSFGFGVFAALRVNRDPLGQLPAGTPALQLVANEAAAAPRTWGVPVGPGFRLGEAQTGTVATDATPTAEPAERTTNASPNTPNPWTASTIKAGATNRSPVPSVQPIPISATAPAQTTPSATEPPEPTASVTGPALPPTTTAVAPTPAVPLTSTASTAAQVNPPDKRQDFEPAPTGTAKAAEEKPAPEAAPKVAAVEPTGSAAPSSAQPADVTGTVPDAAAPEAKIPEHLTRAPERKPTRKIVRRPIERHITKRRLVRPTAAAGDARPPNTASTFDQPVFRSAPQPFQHVPATSRRSAKKTANNTTPTNTFAGPNAR